MLRNEMPDQTDGISLAGVSARRNGQLPVAGAHEVQDIRIASQINTPYGSKVISPSTGILLNNEMAGERTNTSASDITDLPSAEVCRQ